MSIKNRKIFKLATICVAFIFIFFTLLSRQAFAYRSSAGGGDLASFDWGEFGITVGCSIGIAAVGSAIGAGLTSAYGQAATSLGAQVSPATQLAANSGVLTSMGTSLMDSLTTVGGLANGYNTFVATYEIGRAIGTAGAYHGWDQDTIYAVSAIGQAAGVGFMNPSAAMGKNLDTPTEIFTNENSLVTPSNVASAQTGEGTIWIASADPMASATNYASRVGVDSSSIISSNIDMSYRLGDTIIQVPVITTAAVPATFASNSLGNILKGTAVGALGGAGSGLTIIAIDGDRINEGKNPGAGAQIAGLLVGNIMTSFGRKLVDPATYTSSTSYIQRTPHINDPAMNQQHLDDSITAHDPTLNPQAAEYDPKLAYLKNEGTQQVLDDSITAHDPILNPQASEYDPKLAYSKPQDNQLPQDSSATAQKWDYKIIKGTNMGTANEGLIEVGNAIDNFERGHLDSRYQIQAYGDKNTFKVIDTQANIGATDVLGRFAQAAFIDSFNGQNWPTLAAKSLGILASSALSNDAKAGTSSYNNNQALQSLVNGLTQSATQPIFSGLASVYGWDPALYVSLDDGSTKIGAQLQYDFGVRSMALSYVGAKNNDAILNKYLKDYPDLLTNPDSDMEKVKFRMREEMTKEGARLGDLALANKYSISTSLDNLETSRGALFGNFVWGAERSGIFDSALSGGVNLGFTQLWNQKSQFDQMLISSAANMVSAIPRGILWSTEWKHTTESGQWFPNLRLDLKVTDTTSPSGINSPGFDFMQYKLDESGSTAEQVMRFQRLVQYGGLSEGFGLIYHIDEEPRSKIITKAWVASLESLNTSPSLGFAIGASISQASTEFLYKTFSFDAPLLRNSWEAGIGVEPNRISTISFMDYVSNVRQLASMGDITNAIAYQATQANIGSNGAVANNIGGAILQIPGMPQILNMRPERLSMLGVKDYNNKIIPTNLYDIQQLSFDASKMFYTNTYWLPFPNPYYGIRPQTDNADYLKRKGIQEPGNLNSLNNLR